MFPGTYAETTPAKPAIVMVESGETVTYAQLEDRSARLAHVLRGAGLKPGDVVAVLCHNDPRVFDVYWAAMRCGLYITALNHHLTDDELTYILKDSGAGALIASSSCAPVVERLVAAVSVPTALAWGGRVEGCGVYEDALAAAPTTPVEDQPHGAPMLYSSGTTGHPAGVKPPLPPVQVHEGGDPLIGLVQALFGVDARTRYLSPAPLYHAAPLRWCGAVQAHGGTVHVMEKFEPTECLRALQDLKISHAQFVPTMFVRMLQLSDEERSRYDLSDLRYAVHAAAPCPVEVKERMIDWWGPILYEYYAGTEGNGMTVIDSPAWLSHPGTVGQPMLGVLHICGDKGEELPAGQIGDVYFERDVAPFEYHNNPEKTAASRHPAHPTWTTMGDVGHVDADGFLYLSDRRAFTIISGGVNIYPQEIEDAVVMHPAVLDVAVIGVPDPVMGETVKAFIQTREGITPNSELEQQIIEHLRTRIASFKVPRQVEFVTELPRTETGKLRKGVLRDMEAARAADATREASS